MYALRLLHFHPIVGDQKTCMIWDRPQGAVGFWSILGHFQCVYYTVTCFKKGL